jgi:hypothetical protein
MRLSRTLLALGAGALLGSAGCAVVHDYPHHGPPPHAPAHGYRHRVGDVSHVYEAPLGVYLVVGYPDHYFLDGWYYRHVHGYWERCREVDGRWARAEARVVPGRLHARYASQGPEKGRGKGKGPAHGSKGKGGPPAKLGWK